MYDIPGALGRTVHHGNVKRSYDSKCSPALAPKSGGKCWSTAQSGVQFGSSFQYAGLKPTWSDEPPIRVLKILLGQIVIPRDNSE